ncbi:MAG: ABC transporter permease [Tissierellaceae bacterium]|nr:ABC transporter permease [Tissierellaceae bacterium]
MEIIKDIYRKVGFPRLIITVFLILFLVAAVGLGLSLPDLLTDMINRFGMNAIMVLAMVPTIQAGTGVNLNLALGVIFGLIGALVSLELGLQGWNSLIVAFSVAIPLAIIAGYFYGLLLNKIKGQEMTVGNYFGFSLVSLMCIFWLIAPFKNPALVWAMGGKGLRVTLSLDDSMGSLLNNFLSFQIGGVHIPTGLLLFFALCAGLVYLFTNTKTGTALKVSGSGEKFAISNGLNVDRYRVLSVIISTVLAAIGIIVYSQSFGFLQLYNAPLYVSMPAAASILIGGASLKKAKISHVIIGTFLFQGLLVVALPVINAVSDGSMAEIIRISISNGIILYALTRKAGDN